MNILTPLALAAALTAAPAVAATVPGTPLHRLESFQPPKPPKPVLHKSLGTVVTAGFSQAEVAAEQQGAADGVTTINCPEANGCTILFTGNVQILPSVVGSSWAICPVVDGFHPDFTCLLQAPIATVGPGLYAMGSQQGSYSVAKGKHTVQTMVYFQSAGEIFNYDLSYELTTP